MDTIEDLEYVLSIYCAGAKPLPINIEINRTNLVPVGNTSSVTHLTALRFLPMALDQAICKKARPSDLNTGAQAGVHINIQSSTQATVQMNTQQNLPVTTLRL
jgi:hypothetical protein